jgi:hypothetical protein
MGDRYYDSAGEAFSLDQMLQNVSVLDLMIKEYMDQYIIATMALMREDTADSLETCTKNIREIEKAYNEKKSSDPLYRQFQQLSLILNVKNALVLTSDRYNGLMQNGKLDKETACEIRSSLQAVSRIDKDFLNGGGSLEAIRYFNSLYNSRN